MLNFWKKYWNKKMAPKNFDQKKFGSKSFGSKKNWIKNFLDQKKLDQKNLDQKNLEWVPGNARHMSDGWRSEVGSSLSDPKVAMEAYLRKRPLQDVADDDAVNQSNDPPSRTRLDPMSCFSFSSCFGCC